MTVSDYEVIRAYARTALEISHEAVTSCEMEAAYGRLVWHCERLSEERPCLTQVAEAILGEAGYRLLRAAADRGYDCRLSGADDRYANARRLMDEDPRVRAVNPLCAAIASADIIPEEA